MGFVFSVCVHYILCMWKEINNFSSNIFSCIKMVVDEIKCRCSCNVGGWRWDKAQSPKALVAVFFFPSDINDFTTVASFHHHVIKEKFKTTRSTSLFLISGIQLKINFNWINAIFCFSLSCVDYRCLYELEGFLKFIFPQLKNFFLDWKYITLLNQFNC